VVVTGAGVLSPLADSPEALHRMLLEGLSARRPIELFPTDGLAASAGGEIRPFEPQGYVGERNLRPLDRTSRLLVIAAQLALADSGWDDAARGAAEVGLILGTTYCSVHTIAEFDRRSRRLGPAHASPLDFANSVINAAAGQTAIWHRLRGINSTVTAGEASALFAIAQACELVRTGRSKAVLAGGVEELCLESFLGYERAGRLAATGSDEGSGKRSVPFESGEGFSLSEGAALVMMEEAEAAAARGASARAEVLGWGSALAMGEGAEHLAAALGRAIRHALDDAGEDGRAIGFASLSASGSRFDGAEMEGLALGLGEAAADLPVTAIKAMLGEGMGVSSAWQAIDAISTLGDGQLPGVAGSSGNTRGVTAGPRSLPPARRRRALITALGADGHAGALLLGAPESR
jgi:3-oxoacyl-[acyl-carrier-protein] synthase II